MPLDCRAQCYRLDLHEGNFRVPGNNSEALPYSALAPIHWKQAAKCSGPQTSHFYARVSTSLTTAFDLSRTVG